MFFLFFSSRFFLNFLQASKRKLIYLQQNSIIHKKSKITNILSYGENSERKDHSQIAKSKALTNQNTSHTQSIPPFFIANTNIHSKYMYMFIRCLVVIDILIVSHKNPRTPILTRYLVLICKQTCTDEHDCIWIGLVLFGWIFTMRVLVYCYFTY